MEFLHDYKEKLSKALTDDLTFTVLVLILVAVASFGLGKWVTDNATEQPERPVLVPTNVPIAAEDTVAAVSTSQPTAPAAAAQFVASVNGTKYHALSCPGARQINEENKIYFTSTDEAASAGYTPAANCSF